MIVQMKMEMIWLWCYWRKRRKGNNSIFELRKEVIMEHPKVFIYIKVEVVRITQEKNWRKSFTLFKVKIKKSKNYRSGNKLIFICLSSIIKLVYRTRSFPILHNSLQSKNITNPKKIHQRDLNPSKLNLSRKKNLKRRSKHQFHDYIFRIVIFTIL